MVYLKITSISFIVIIKEAQKYSLHIYMYIHIDEQIGQAVIVPRVQGSKPSKAPFCSFFLFVFISYISLPN